MATALELVFRITSLGTDELKKVEAAVKSVGEGTRLTGQQLKTFDATLQSLVGAGKTYTQALEEMARSQGVLSNSVRSTAAELLRLMASAEGGAESVEHLGKASAHAVTDVQAASAAIRSFEGHIPIRAVEQFSVKMLGLGPIMQAAFPLVGVIAVTEMIGKMAGEVLHLAQNFFFLTDAEEEVLKLSKALAGETEKSIHHQGQLAVQALKDSGKHVEAAKLELALLASQPIKLPKLEPKVFGSFEDGKLKGGDFSGSFADEGRLLKLHDAFGEVIPAGLPERIKQVKANMAELRGEIALIDKNGADPLSLHYKSQDEKALEAYAGLLQTLTEKQREYASEVQSGEAKVSKARTEEGKKAAQEAAELAKWHLSTEREFTKMRDSALAKELTGYDAIRARLQSIVDLKAAEHALTESELELVRQTAEAENRKYSADLLKKVTTEARKGAVKDFEESEKEQQHSSRFADKQFLDKLRKDIALGEKAVRADHATQDLYDKADADAVQRAISRQQRLIELSTPAAGPGGAARREASIIEQAYRARLDLAAQLLDIETRKADRMATAEEKETALERARYEAGKAADEARADRELRLLELRKKSLDQYRAEAGKIFDAITSGNPGQGLKNLAIGEAKNIGRNAFESIVGPMLGSLGGVLGIGGSPKNQAALKTEQHTKRTADGVEKLVAGAGGVAGGADAGLSGGGKAAATLLGSIQKTLAGSGLASIFGNGAGGNFSAGLGSVLSGNALATVLGQNTTGTTTTAGRVGAGVGLAGAVGAGAYGIASGIRQGGVGGDLKAAGSAAGLTGALVGNIATMMKATGPLLSAIPIVGTIAAIALPLLGGLIGSNPEKRAKEIQKELALATYQAPVALNVTQDGSGRYTDFDARGNIRKSLLSAIPQVEQPYIERIGGGWSGRPVTYQNVPGRVDSPYGPAAQPVVQNVTYNISAIDVQSFDQAIQKHRASVSNAVASDLEGNEGRLAAAIRYKVGR